MAKCGGCGKFEKAAELTRCSKCPGSYHPACVGLSSPRVPQGWLCPCCKAKAPKTDNSCTPVKGLSDAGSDIAQFRGSNRSPIGEPAEVNIAHEIRCLREELSATRVELRQFREEMANLRLDVDSCRQRIDTVEGKVSDLERRFEEKGPSSYDPLEQTIAELKLQLNERDQELLQNDIIITGIPETKTESPLHVLKVLSTKLGVELDEREVVNVERVGMVRRNFTQDAAESTRPRAFAARLSRRAVRDQLLRAARVRRGLTTADLDLQGQLKRVYVNERLTPLNGKLFSSAREAGQRHQYKYVWTKDGRIYARKEDGMPAQRIRAATDFARIFVTA